MLRRLSGVNYQGKGDYNLNLGSDNGLDPSSLFRLFIFKYAIWLALCGNRPKPVYFTSDQSGEVLRFISLKDLK